MVELAVLVMLHQVVVGVAGKGQRAESERVHRRAFQHFQVRLGGGQVRQVKGDDVVAQNEIYSLGHVVQLGKGCGQGEVSVGIDQGLAAVGAQCGEGVDTLVLGADFEVEGETVSEEAFRCASGLSSLLRRLRVGPASSASDPLSP